ncbi:MAG TPA: DUF4199 domain-containing protein [Chitinophagaceae bacterium]|nr:DUF4199 domain-containing protein [Chitinophagaceae bacterium]
MKKAFLRYGLLSGAFIVVLFTLDMSVLGSFGVSEVAGYISIVLSLCFVYFGLRYFRDKQNNGVLTFGQGIKLGLLITLIPSTCFGAFDLVYVRFFNPDFYDKYTESQIARLKATVPAAEFETKAAAMREQMKFWSQPWADFLLMFLTVAAIGVIITVLSAFILKRKAAEKTVQPA